MSLNQVIPTDKLSEDMMKGFDMDDTKEKSNSLSRFIKENCANWVHDECLGVDVFCVPFRNPGKCFVMVGRPCGYFRKCVLGSEDTKYPHPCFVKEPAYEIRVRKQYKAIDHTVVEADTRRCPECDAALQPRQRYCLKCATKRQRKAQRLKYQKNRLVENIVKT